MTKRWSSFVVFASAAAILGACAASSSRNSFDDTAASSATPPADTTVPPTKTSQSAPIPPPPPPDASVPDTGPACTPVTPTSKCGLVPQCGCASTETCDVADSSGAVDCVTAGTAPMGKPCTTTAGCALGLSCVFGTCHSFCNDTSKACTATGTGSCINVQTTAGTGVPNYDVCLVKCDLRDPTACGGVTAAGTGACIVDDAGNTDCQKITGTKTDGQACPANDCGPGLGCINVTTNGVTTALCKRWCQVGSADCGGGKPCSGFQTKMMVDGKEYGACP